jgi:hypothetical protein
VKFFPKAGEQSQGLILIRDLVGGVIRGAAVGIHVAEILPQVAGQQKGYNREVLVVGMGQFSRGGLSGGYI